MASGSAVAMGTVLVVEDDALIRDAVVELLEYEGFEAVAAGDGAQALRWLRRGEVAPAIILLDLMMPVMDGWQFRAALLADPELAAIPVLVMSASDPEGVAADAVIAKPFDARSLLDAIGRLARSGSPDERGPAGDRQRDPGGEPIPDRQGGGVSPGAAASGRWRIATEFMQ